MEEVCLNKVDERAAESFRVSINSLPSNWYTDVPEEYQQENFSSANYRFDVSKAVLSNQPTKVDVIFHTHKPIDERYFLTVLASSIDDTSCLVQVILSEDAGVHSLLYEGNPNGRVVDYETVEYPSRSEGAYETYSQNILSSVMDFVHTYDDSSLESLQEQSRSPRDVCSDKDYPRSYVDFAPY